MSNRIVHPVNSNQFRTFYLALSHHLPKRNISFEDVGEIVERQEEVSEALFGMCLSEVQQGKLFAASAVRFNHNGQITGYEIEDTEIWIALREEEPMIIDLNGMVVDPSLDETQLIRGITGSAFGWVTIHALNEGRELEITGAELPEFENWAYVAGIRNDRVQVIAFKIMPFDESHIILDE